jgi:hypothetical protein
MKNLATIIALFLCFSAFSQDTLTHYQWIKGKKVMIYEITNSLSTAELIVKSIPIALFVIATILFIFYKPKPKDHGRETPKKTA